MFVDVWADAYLYCTRLSAHMFLVSARQVIRGKESLFSFVSQWRWREREKIMTKKDKL